MSTKFTQSFQSNLAHTELTYPSGATSVEVELNGGKLMGVRYPSAMTSTGLAVQVFVGGAYVPAVDSGNTALIVPVATSSFVYLNPADAAALDGTIRFVGATAGEAAARTLTIVSRAL